MTGKAKCVAAKLKVLGCRSAGEEVDVEGAASGSKRRREKLLELSDSLTSALKQ